MNIIYDLGGVVFNWQPEKLIKKLFDDESERKLIADNLFFHPDWIEMDRGTLLTEEAINRSFIRTGIEKKRIKMSLDSVPNALTLNKETVDIIKETKKNGHNLYVLSNMHIDFANFLTDNYDFWELFSGIEFSCFVKMIKPDKSIFNYILEKYSLEKNETIFIDDSEANIKTAKEIGIKTVHFTTPEKCTADLKKIGAI